MTRATTAAASAKGQDLFKGMTTTKQPKAPKKEPRAAIQTGEHGRYQIKSGLLAGEYVARAFPKAPTTARGLIAEAHGETEEEAIAALHAAIDARETKRNEARREDTHTGVAVPSVEEYVEAISQVALTAPQRAMLTALSLAGEEGLSESRMARAGGYKSKASARRSFTGAGTSMSLYLSTGAEAQEGDTAEGLALLGFQETGDGEEGTGPWVLYPELRDAVHKALRPE
ncbi:hypothetical protein [Marinovum sp.]|uniref:hypothetical protein n=1 Tax=Marinovum sp. TaxID=2024839 RepID=UPI003A92E2B2